MTDTPIIIAFVLLTTFCVFFSQWENERLLELEDCASVNAMILEEATLTTNRLNECKKRRKR